VYYQATETVEVVYEHTSLLISTHVINVISHSLPKYTAYILLSQLDNSILSSSHVYWCIT